MKFDTGPACPRRCRCRCQRTCEKCGAKCMALANEKCAFFCEHHLGKKNDPPTLAFVFHGDHWMPYNDAESEIIAQFQRIVIGESDEPVPVQALECPYPGCHHRLSESVAFSVQIKESTDLLRVTENRGLQMLHEDQALGDAYVMPVPKFMWCVCQCGELIAHKYTGDGPILVTCPHCGRIRGQQFE